MLAELGVGTAVALAGYGLTWAFVVDPDTTEFGLRELGVVAAVAATTWATAYAVAEVGRRSPGYWSLPAAAQAGAWLGAGASVVAMLVCYSLTEDEDNACYTAAAVAAFATVPGGATLGWNMAREPRQAEDMLDMSSLGRREVTPRLRLVEPPSGARARGAGTTAPSLVLPIFRGTF